MKTGNWNIDVNINGMPQKIATAFDKLEDTLVGARYVFIAYLGSQVVNGINHAVLAKQIVTTGLDSANIVMLIFNEKPRETEATLVAIERIVEEGGELGGTNISVDKVLDLEGEPMKIWYGAFEGYVGISMRPIAYLGNQVVNGASHIFAATAEPMTLEGTKEAVVVTINTMQHTVSVAGMLNSRQANALRYTFTW